MILDDLRTKLIDFQKQRDLLRVGVLRYLISAINNKQIELRGQKIDMTDEHILKVIHKQIKQRNESIEAYKMGNRPELVEKETSELKILEEILQLFEPHEN